MGVSLAGFVVAQAAEVRGGAFDGLGAAGAAGALGDDAVGFAEEDAGFAFAGAVVGLGGGVG